MAFKYEHTFLGFARIHSRKAIESGTKVVLRPPLTIDLELIPDGMMLKQEAYVGRGYVDVYTSTKGTNNSDDGDGYGRGEYKINRTDSYHGDQINEANIVFARSCLALLIGYKKRIVSV